MIDKLTEQLAEALRKFLNISSSSSIGKVYDCAEEALAAYDAAKQAVTWGSNEVKTSPQVAAALAQHEDAKANGGCKEDLRTLENVRLKFTSGNSVPVERASVTASEWQSVERLLAAQPLPPPPEQK